jgi:hypothetical protein
VKIGADSTMKGGEKRGGIDAVRDGWNHQFIGSLRRKEYDKG